VPLAGAALIVACAVVSCATGSSQGGGADALAPSSTEGVPRIWTLSVGISRHHKQELSLQFAHRDAAAVDAFFASAAGSSVPAERRTLLTDADATRAAILTALSDISRRSARDDMIVLFLALHGVPDPGGPTDCSGLWPRRDPAPPC
jgi:hypothetical protein